MIPLRDVRTAWAGGEPVGGMWLGGEKVWAKPDDAVAPSARLAVHIDADIDTVGERDDISAMALWLATQDDFDIVGLTASAPDSNAQEYHNCIDAYEADRPTLIANGADPALFKPAADLRSMVIQGAKVDAPAKGYWAAGDSGYAAPHAAAQALIANARDHGNPTSTDPTHKLWVIVQGGYTTLAQAAYEAVQLGELPDFFDRIRVVGQPNWNSSWAPNAWNYLFGDMWPAESDPGLFGNAWMLNGYLQWHAFNRDNGTTDKAFWDTITSNSSMGDHLRSTLTRPSGAFTRPHFRAGDAGAWFWLLSAKEQGNYSPENPDNLCGVYRTYAGVDPWPSQTVGYGAGSGTGSVPNPEGITWSQTLWAPELKVDSFADAYAAVDLSAWYERVTAYMARYQGARAPAQVGPLTITGSGADRTITWPAPQDGGSPITDYIITLDGETVIDGVGAATSYTLTGIADGRHTLTVAAVNEVGTGPASAPVSFTVGSSAPAISGIFPMSEGDGTSTASKDGVIADLTSATWGSAPTRIVFNGASSRLISPAPDAAVDMTDHIVAVVARLDAIAGNTPFISRNGPHEHNQRVFQFRNSNGILQYIANEHGGSAPSVIITGPAGTVVAGEWALFLAFATSAGVELRKNGMTVHSGNYGAITPNRSADILGVQHQWGCRFNPRSAAYLDFMAGALAAGAILYNASVADVGAVETELRNIAAAKGITLP